MKFKSREVGSWSTAMAARSEEEDGGGGALRGRGRRCLALRKRTMAVRSEGGGVEVDGSGATVLGFKEEDGSSVL
jgi:hypothetical protein